MKNRGWEILRWMASVFRANTLILIVNLYTGVLAARVLGPAGKGVYSAALLWATMAGTIAMVGLPQSLVYFYGREEKPGPQSQLVGSALALATLWGGVATAILWFVLPGALGHLGATVVIWARLAALLVPVSTLSTVLLHFLAVEKAFARYNFVRLLRAALVAVPMTLLAILGLLSPTRLVAVVLVSSLVVFSMTAWESWRVMRVRGIHLGIHTGTSLRLTVQGMRYFSVGIAAMFNAQLDQMLATIWLNRAAVGRYSIAVSSLTVVGIATAAFTAVFMPSIVSDAREDVLRRTATALRRGSLALLGLTGLLLGLAYPTLLLLYGPAYSPTWYAVLGLAGVPIASGLVQITAQGCYTLGIVDIPLIGEVTGALSGALLLWILTPRYGIAGAGLAGTLSYLLDWLVTYRLWKSRVDPQCRALPGWQDVRVTWVTARGLLMSKPQADPAHGVEV